LEIDKVLTGAAVPHVSRLSKRGIPPAHPCGPLGWACDKLLADVDPCSAAIAVAMLTIY